MKRIVQFLAAAAALVWAAPSVAGELLPPVKVLAGGKPIDVQRSGHAAPFLGDFDGDGNADLLVGEFHEGRMRVFRGAGGGTEPRLGDYQWFQAGGELGRVPVS